MDLSHKPRLCIAVCEQTIQALERTLALASEQAELVEVRLDCLEAAELETNGGLITELLQRATCETILTLRPQEEGGADEETRHAFWSGAIFSESLFDVELELAEKTICLEASQLPVDWSRTICSYHDFDGIPANLDQIYERLSATPARVLKVAVEIQDASECLPLFHLIDRARADGREIIAIAMGTPGLATRILGPSRGAYLTYATLPETTATAPGQITAGDLKNIYRFDQIDRQTQIFGLLGAPISHSLSPHMHNAAFAATGKNAVYLPFEVNDVKAFIKRMVHPRTRELSWPLSGLSVTAPHKFAVMDQLDWIEPAAHEIGAVNTIMVEDDSVKGYNTDASGFLRPLVAKLGDLTNARCAIIGTGGVANAALWALRQAGARLTLLARDEEKGRNLAARFGAEWKGLAEASFDGLDVVVNATPLGTSHQFENETPATAEQLRGARLAYDLVYNPTETKFLREAREAGCQTLGGLAMLVAQAEGQFRLWIGKSSPEGVMLEAATTALKTKI